MKLTRMHRYLKIFESSLVLQVSCEREDDRLRFLYRPVDLRLYNKYQFTIAPLATNPCRQYSVTVGRECSTVIYFKLPDPFNITIIYNYILLKY